MRRIALLSLIAATAALTATPARADINLGTIVGAGLGGLVGNQIGHGTGKNVATAVGVVTGGVIGHSIGNSWNSHPGHASSYATTTQTYYGRPVYYQPTYVAPPAVPVNVVYGQGYYGHGRHWRRPVVVEQVYVQQPQAVQTLAPLQDMPQQFQNNGYCREYTQRVTVGGQVQESYGTACQQQDGSWKTID